jgi:hypothetical protein
LTVGLEIYPYPGLVTLIPVKVGIPKTAIAAEPPECNDPPWTDRVGVPAVVALILVKLKVSNVTEVTLI